MKIDTFRKRFKAAEKTKKVNWESLYRETMELFCPNREAFYHNVPGQKKGRLLYTSSPYSSLDKAANNIHSSMTPHMKKWIHLKPGRMIPEDRKGDATLALQDIRNVLFDHIFASNFDLAASEFFKDIMIGTAAMLITGTAKNPLVFTSVPLNELYITTGALGTVDTIFRKYKVKAGAIMETWDDATLDETTKLLADEKPEQEISIVEGTVPAKVKVFNAELNREVEIDGFKYCVMLEKGDSYIVERDMSVNPWVVARWSVMSGEEWGRGPAIIALNDAKTLNQFVRLHMQSMELAVHPMYTIVDDGVINISAIRLGPGAAIPVSANDGVFGPSIAPLRSGGNFQVGQMEMARLEGAINDQLYTEPLGPVHLPVKTATEISIRQQELSKRIGSAYGRLQYEFVKPLINSCLYQLDRLGLIDMADFKVDGHTIAIEAESPLAQGQAQDEVNNVINYVQFAVSTFGPEVALTLMKPEEIMSFMGESLHIPQQVKMSEEDKAQAQELLSQLMMQQGGQGEQQALPAG